MFPLGTVLLPGGAIPLHVFEDRYRRLVRACLDGDHEFGVVLIERGSEVGGGDVRTSVGTVAAIADAREAPDGRWAVLAVGVRRIRVLRWLPDDPYPMAEVEDWDDPAPGPAAGERLAEVVALLRTVVALKGEVGDPVTPVPNELAGDPVLAAYQACWLAPVPAFDKQRLLECESLESRIDLLERLLRDEREVLDLRLGGA